MHALSATLLAATLLATGGQAGQSAPPATSGEIYTAAHAREQALRAGTGSPPPTLREYRSIVTAYDNLVRRFPQSGYADDALWQGGMLAIDAFDRFGEERDRSTARRMLQLLVDGYPYSPFVARAKDAVKTLAERAAPKVGPAATPPAASSAKPPTPAATPPAKPPTPPAARPASPAATGAAALPQPAAPTPATTPASEKSVILRSITRTAMLDRVRVTLDLDGATTHRSERVEDPPRVLVDIRDTQPGPAVALGTITHKDSAASQVRVGLQPNRVTRVVVSLDGVSRYRISTTDQPYRIVIDCDRTQPVASVPAPVEPAAAPKPPARARVAPGKAPTPLPTRAITPVSHGLPMVVSIDRALVHPPAPAPEPIKAAPATPVATSPSVAPSSQPAAQKATTPPAAPITGGRGPYSLSRQLGLGVSRIVIDPGHGGHDPGALGTGISEAEIVLDVSLRLEKLLKDAGVEVVLTRRTDEYVPLEERPAIARREQADLFLSIHANASRSRSVRGTETYYLNFSTDPAAEEVAARENAATNRTINNLPDILKAITLNNKLDESRTFAGLIQKAMAAQLGSANSGMRNLGVKQAPFVVLIGAEMPSVLVEIAFITNPQEGRLLKSGAYRQKIAQALFDAVRGYQKSLKSDPVAVRH